LRPEIEAKQTLNRSRKSDNYSPIGKNLPPQRKIPSLRAWKPAQAKNMSVDELFERISKVHSGETQVSVGCNLEPNPCPNWLWRLEWPDRFTLSMVDFFLVGEMGFSPAIYGDLTPYAEGNPIQTRYCEWRPLRTELGSYYSNHWFLEWMRSKTGNAYQLHLLTAPRDSDVWVYSKFDLDIYLTWGAEHLNGEDCHFVSPNLSQWRVLVDHILKAENGPVAA
jgi:hypothetical protein